MKNSVLNPGEKQVIDHYRKTLEHYIDTSWKSIFNNNEMVLNTILEKKTLEEKIDKMISLIEDNINNLSRHIEK